MCEMRGKYSIGNGAHIRLWGKHWYTHTVGRVFTVYGAEAHSCLLQWGGRLAGHFTVLLTLQLIHYDPQLCVQGCLQVTFHCYRCTHCYKLRGVYWKTWSRRGLVLSKYSLLQMLQNTLLSFVLAGETIFCPIWFTLSLEVTFAFNCV